MRNAENLCKEREGVKPIKCGHTENTFFRFLIAGLCFVALCIGELLLLLPL